MKLEDIEGTRAKWQHSGRMNSNYDNMDYNDITKA